MSYILFQARQCDARAPRYPCTGLGEVSDFLRWVEFDLADDVLQGAPAGMGGMGNEQRVRDRAAVPPASALQAHSPRKQAIPTFPIAILRYTSTRALKAHK